MPEDDITLDTLLSRFPPRLGPCRLLKWLGAGSMGSVVLGELAEDRPYGAPGDRVAVKILHPNLIRNRRAFERFLREAKLGARILHPCVVQSFEADIADEPGGPFYFLVMEYVAGRSLWAMIEQLGTLPEPLLRHLAVQTARGLEAIHASGAVHRDLKPTNILITPDHCVKIMDLGVAHLLDEASSLTDTGDFVGSLHYAAPEQFDNGDVGPAADLYSFGVILYEAATGSRPFAARAGTP